MDDFVAAYFDEGGRYRFSQQPAAAMWNLARLGAALRAGGFEPEAAAYFDTITVPVGERPSRTMAAAVARWTSNTPSKQSMKKAGYWAMTLRSRLTGLVRHRLGSW